MLTRRSTALAIGFTILAAAGAAAQRNAQTGPAAMPAPARNTAFLELGGNAVLYSLNYERFFTPGLGLRLGAEYVRVEEEGDEITAGVFPVMGTFLIGRGNSHLEAALGVGIVTGGVDLAGIADLYTNLYGTATFGYRYQKPQGGLMFRAGFTPLRVGSDLIATGGGSVGYAF